MHDTTHLDASQNGTVEQIHEWLHRNGEDGQGGEQKIYGGEEEGLPSRTRVIKRKVKRKEESPLEIVCGWIVENQIGLSINLLMLLAMTHMCFPRARRHTRKFVQLSYYNPETQEYNAGWNDIHMVAYWIVVFTGLRAAVMEYILLPLAKKGGIETEKDKTRFAEQAWGLIYASILWPLGMYILVTSDYWLNLKELWTDWPNREVPRLRKWYILVQYAFWLQQILVINIEKRRKDYWQMFTHHIVTTILIFTSYGYHQTKVANVILCTMDVADIFLPFAKCLKYLGYDSICDVFFGIFMLVWVLARHICFMIICWSVYADIPATIQYGCYRGRNGAITGPFPVPTNSYSYLFEPFTDPEGIVCWDNGIKWYFLSALLFLQGIMVMWFAMILRVAISVLKGAQADDVRSDDGSEDDLEHEDEKLISKSEEPEEKLLPFEEEVGVEAINLKGRTSNASRYRRSEGRTSASGVSIPGHSDRKELLGRIGCDKGS